MKGISDSILRPYQIEAQRAIVAAWDGAARAVMLQMPTGAGKTRLFVNLIASRPARYLIVTHREELVEQISETLAGHYHLEHGILQGKNTRNIESNIIVASIQSWARLWEKPAMDRLSLRPPTVGLLEMGRQATGKGGFAAGFDYIIIDEAHHSLADSYKELWKVYPCAKKLGVTATPYRLQKAAFIGLYDVLIESWPMRRMIAEGYLANYRMLSVSEHRAAIRRINRLTKFGADGDYKAKDLKDILDIDEEIDFLYECYRQNAVGKQGIVYAVNREHAAKLAERFTKEGIAAVAIDSKTKAKERKQKIEDFKEGKIQVLVNVELFTEGFDCPSIEFVMLARPTRSLAMYMQQVGRALRVTPAKESRALKSGANSSKSQGTGHSEPVLILDCAGLRHRFGFPDRPHDWQAHFKGVRPAIELYEKRTLGEQEHFPFLREIKRELGKCAPKPAREILPSDTNVHIFVDNIRALYGTCDNNGNTISEAMYKEIHRTPYGWYQGVYKELGAYFPVIFNKQGEECLMCSSLKKVEYNVYEAMWNNRAIRFNLHLQIIPQETLVAGGMTIYQISHNSAKLYSPNLDLGGIMTIKKPGS